MPIKFWRTDNIAERSLRQLEDDFNGFEKEFKIQQVNNVVLPSEPDSQNLAVVLLWAYYTEK